MREHLWPVVAVALLAVACGGGSGTSNPPLDVSDVTNPPDSTVDGLTPDLPTAETSNDVIIGPRDGYPDLEQKDGYGDADGLQEVVSPKCEEKPYEFGCPCTENLDCEGVWCIDGPKGKVCSKECVEECPYGYSCQLMGGTCPDCQWLCVPKWSNLCRPCTSDNDCIAVGFSLNNLFIDSGAAGRFCGPPCSVASHCPPGSNFA